MSSKAKENVLRLATLSAAYNIVLQIGLRVVTFVANAFILRFISRDVLGVINVRLLLLYTTIQFLSREPFRRVAIGAVKSHDWSRIVNITCLSVPLSLFFGTFLSYVWYYGLERPDEQIVSDYGIGVIAIFVSVFIELMAEPVYVWAQKNSFIKFKVIADGLFLTTRTLLMTSFVSQYPEKAVLVFSLSQIVSSIIYFLIYYIYFVFHQRLPLRHFLPQFDSSKPFLDRSLLIIAFSFLKNTTLKQFLTEGERFVMTFFSVISFGEQGVYDVINNIGSLPARLVFQQIEESGYLLFTQKINRQIASKDQSLDDLRDSSIYLKNLIKLMSLLGSIILIFGYNYSELALLIYGGHKLSEDLGTTLLQWHCVYVLFIAINGITECFTFAAMDSKQIDSFNKKMINISLVFLVSSYLLTKWMGCQGFIIANCVNMAARIVISLRFIDRYYGATKADNPLKGSIPGLPVIVIFGFTFVGLFVLRIYLCCHTSILKAFVFVMIGSILLIVNLLVVYLSEKQLVGFVINLFKTGNKSKSS